MDRPEAAAAAAASATAVALPICGLAEVGRAQLLEDLRLALGLLLQRAEPGAVVAAPARYFAEEFLELCEPRLPIGAHAALEGLLVFLHAQLFRPQTRQTHLMLMETGPPTTVGARLLLKLLQALRDVSEPLLKLQELRCVGAILLLRLLQQVLGRLPSRIHSALADSAQLLLETLELLLQRGHGPRGALCLLPGLVPSEPGLQTLHILLHRALGVLDGGRLRRCALRLCLHRVCLLLDLGATFVEQLFQLMPQVPNAVLHGVSLPDLQLGLLGKPAEHSAHLRDPSLQIELRVLLVEELLLEMLQAQRGLPGSLLGLVGDGRRRRHAVPDPARQLRAQPRLQTVHLPAHSCSNRVLLDPRGERRRAQRAALQHRDKALP
mmetsp:Transcript_103434/g.299266  ORF Transcript_103434/g.299266 Transcript_103434/m.299266 type:complete len:380 (+) Transcript_103434:376-1515(+)